MDPEEEKQKNIRDMERIERQVKERVYKRWKQHMEVDDVILEMLADELKERFGLVAKE